MPCNIFHKAQGSTLQGTKEGKGSSVSQPASQSSVVGVSVGGLHLANDLVRHHALRDSLPPSSHPLGTPLLLLHTSFQPETLGERDFRFLLRCSSHSAPLCPQGGQPRQLRYIKKKCQARNQKFRLKACLHATTRPHPAEYPFRR